MNHMQKFYKQNKVIIYLIIFATLCCLLYPLIIADEISIDEEMAATRTMELHTKLWLGFSRYGISALNNILFSDFDGIPFFNMMLSVLLLITASITLLYFIKKISGDAPKPAYFALCALIAIYPSNISFLIFNNVNVPNTFAIFISIISVYLIYDYIQNKRWSSVIIGIILCTFSISIYQSFVSFYLTCAIGFVLALVYQQSLKGIQISLGSFFMIVIKYIACLAVALSIFYLLDAILLRITGMQHSQYIDSLVQIQSIKDVIRNLLTNMRYLIFQSGINGGENIQYIFPIFLISQLSLMFKRGLRNKLLIILLSIALVFAPFALAVLFIGIMIRAIVGIGLAVGFSLFFTIFAIWIWIKDMKQTKIHQNIMTAICIILFCMSFSYIYKTNTYYYATHIKYIRDENFANMLAADIIDEIDQVKIEKPVIILGSYQIKTSQNITKHGFEGSFFSFDQVPFRSLYFMNYLGYDFAAPSHAMIENSKQYATEMPCYPKEESIKEFDEFIIVKLSEELD